MFKKKVKLPVADAKQENVPNQNIFQIAVDEETKENSFHFNDLDNSDDEYYSDEEEVKHKTEGVRISPRAVDSRKLQDVKTNASK